MNCKQTAQTRETAKKACTLCCGSCTPKQEDALWTVAQLAESMQRRGLNTGRNRLHTWLREHGFTERSRWNAPNLPTRRALDLGLMVVVYDEHWNRERSWMIKQPSIRITPLGQAYFTGLFVQEG